MLRPGADPENLQASDFLCNFCGRGWSDDNQMIEGHQGSLMCARCLTVAYAEIVLINPGPPPGEAPKCVLCLEHRDEALWRSPVHDDQFACRRCVRQAATTMERDPDAKWKKPSG